MSKQINSIKALESCVGMTPGPRDLKVIDFLDSNAVRYILHSPCVFMSITSKDTRRVKALIAGGSAGFVKTEKNQLHIPLESIEGGQCIETGDALGSLFVIPTQKETLRVNGRVVSVTNTMVSIEVSECYLHCAKAFIRSKLWEEYDIHAGQIQSEAEFCGQSRFMLVATGDIELNADLSPKGDPAGKLLHIENGFAWYADRPGNRRVDGFRNILSNQNLELMAVVAGSTQVLRITGTAELYSEHTMKFFFEVERKIPNIVVKVKIESVVLEDSEALKRANLWPPQAPPIHFKATEIWKDHVKLSKVNGIDAMIAKTAVSVPGVIESGIDWDYKNNVY